MRIGGHEVLVGVGYLDRLGWYNVTIMDVDKIIDRGLFLPIGALLAVLMLASAAAVALVFKRRVLDRLARMQAQFATVEGGRVRAVRSGRERRRDRPSLARLCRHGQQGQRQYADARGRGRGAHRRASRAGLSRPAHRHRQPPRLRRCLRADPPQEPGRHARPAADRYRRLQVDQRHARPPGRRPRGGGSGRPADPAAPPGRCLRALGWRRVHPRRRRHQAGRARPARRSGEDRHQRPADRTRRRWRGDHHRRRRRQRIARRRRYRRSPPSWPTRRSIGPRRKAATAPWPSIRAGAWAAAAPSPRNPRPRPASPWPPARWRPSWSRRTQPCEAVLSISEGSGVPWIPKVGSLRSIHIEPTGPLGPGGRISTPVFSPCWKFLLGS